MSLITWANSDLFSALRDKFNAVVAVSNAYGLGNGDAASVNNLLVPVGGGLEWYATTLPNSNFKFADGSAVSRTTYAALFALIGTAYGAGDGSTTFNLPNKSSKVAVGFDSTDTDYNALGKTGGYKVITLTSVQSGLPNHDHVIKGDGGSGGNFSLLFGTNLQTSYTLSSTGAGSSNATVNGGAQDASTAHENRQPYVVCNTIIRVL